MRILIATGIFPPDHGGPATYVPAFADACLQREHSARVVAYGNPFLVTGESYPVSRIPRLVLPIRHFLFFIACLFRGFRADVIFAQDASSSGVPAACAAWILRKRLVVKIVGDFSWEYARNAGMTADTIEDFEQRLSHPSVIRAIRFAQWLVCRQSARIIVPSAYLSGIVSGWGVDPTKITVIHNAVPLPLASVHAARDPFLIFSAGRLVPWKGFDALIRALADARRSFPLARLTIAGNGPCREALAACARDHGIADAVSFPGALSPSEMADVYRRAGCFVLFSSYEGFSHVLLEALSYGTPVIASDAGGNRELITDGANGILLPSGDEHALAAALSGFLAAPLATIPRPGFPDGNAFTWNLLMEKTLSCLGSRNC